MTERDSPTSRLTPLQQAILDRLWTGGPATADETREALAERHPLKDSSVRTLLRRLEARGLVSHRTRGKIFVYAAEVRPGGIAARAVREIIDRFCQGSVERFLTGMVDERLLSPAELERLARKVRKERRRS